MNQRQINMYTELDYQQIELRVFANLGKRRPWYKRFWYKLFCRHSWKNIYS
jgi:DNA polymerase I-like protein with 3'-5' exonuclease and polymerase domains